MLQGLRYMSLGDGSRASPSTALRGCEGCRLPDTISPPETFEYHLVIVTRGLKSYSGWSVMAEEDVNRVE